MQYILTQEEFDNLISKSKYEEKWYKQELSDHGVVSNHEVAKFVKAAGTKINKISTNNFNSDLVKKTAELYEVLKSL